MDPVQNYLSFERLQNYFFCSYLLNEKQKVRIILLKQSLLNMYTILFLQLVVKMIHMLGSYSTRNNSKQNEKNMTSARFFKKFSTTDENEKNVVNYLDKLIPHKQIVNTTASTGALNTLRNASNKKLGRKKSINNLTSMSGKALKTLDSMGSISGLTKNIQLKDIKEKSYKNLKLASSIQFPKILCKSISQTTIHKRTDEKTLKLLQKMGMEKKSTNNLKKKSSCFGLGSNIKINQFQLGKKLGSGRFGSVYLAQEKETKLICAIKVLNKLKIKQAKMEQQIIMQIKLQSYMNHPNVLKMFGYFHDSKNIYLILQFSSQCLFKDFRAKGKFSEQETAYFGKQVIASLKYMHNEYIMHRDIKPENILVQYGVLKLSDFGWSTYSPLYKRQTFCGTIDYVPPEIVQGSSYDERVDIWALGVLLYELASGKAPFETRDQNITYDKILHSECRYPHHFSDQLVNLLRKILDKNPANRPDLEQIQQHEWFQKYKTTGRFISKPIWTAWNNL